MSVEELKDKNTQEHEMSDFVIEKMIELPLEQWEHFKENLLNDYEFFKNIMDW